VSLIWNQWLTKHCRWFTFEHQSIHGLDFFLLYWWTCWNFFDMTEAWGLSIRVNGWFCMWCWWISNISTQQLCISYKGLHIKGYKLFLLGFSGEKYWKLNEKVDVVVHISFWIYVSSIQIGLWLVEFIARMHIFHLTNYVQFNAFQAVPYIGSRCNTTV